MCLIAHPTFELRRLPETVGRSEGLDVEAKEVVHRG